LRQGEQVSTGRKTVTAACRTAGPCACSARRSLVRHERSLRTAGSASRSGRPQAAGRGAYSKSKCLQRASCSAADQFARTASSMAIRSGSGETRSESPTSTRRKSSHRIAKTRSMWATSHRSCAAECWRLHAAIGMARYRSIVTDASCARLRGTRKSLGEMLVVEGLARRWNEPLRDWCAGD
jgi:hypothetical protein